MALAGMQDELGGDSQTPVGAMDLSVGPSMFETLGRKQSLAMPSAEEMAKQMDELRHNRRVAVKGVRVRTFDLRNDTDRKEYACIMEILLQGVVLKTHAVLVKTPPQFVNDAGGPGYIVHMEWIEFELITEPAATTGEAHGNQGSQLVGSADTGASGGES